MMYFPENTKIHKERKVMNPLDILGYTAGLLTSLSAYPQLRYSYRSRDVSSIRLGFLTMLMVGLFLWAIYGLILRSVPMALFNTVGFLLWVPVFWLKVKENRRSELIPPHWICLLPHIQSLPFSWALVPFSTKALKLHAPERPKNPPIGACDILLKSMKWPKVSS